MYHKIERALSALVLLSMVPRCLMVPAVRADSDRDNQHAWMPMPDGRFYHRTCIHHHPAPFSVEKMSRSRGSKVHKRLNAKDQSSTLYPPCQFRSKSMVPTSDSTYPERLKRAVEPQYYSDWSVYAQTSSPAGYEAMESAWTVPPPPMSSGPAGLSSVYLFNGLEDGGGHHGNATLILQPVLSFGKSGCVLDPARWHSWHLGAFLVDGNGRAHCGPQIPVEPGQKVVGRMQLIGPNQWNVTATAMSPSGGMNQTSSYTASLGDKVLIDAAYLTLEGMVIYKCAAYPPGGGTLFTDLTLLTGNGTLVKGAQSVQWTPEVRHSECGQRVIVSSAGVTLVYNSTSP